MIININIDIIVNININNNNNNLICELPVLFAGKAEKWQGRVSSGGENYEKKKKKTLESFGIDTFEDIYAILIVHIISQYHPQGLSTCM